MKKHLTTLFLMAVTMFAALSFTACGEEVNTDDPKPTGPTEFISEADDTRTSMNDERYFYWEPTDNIYINTSGTTWVRSDDNTIEGNAQTTCKFIFNNTFTNAGYPVVYTGNDTTATAATEVNIAPVQKQTVWNNAEHFGESGDCGTATAARQDNGTYKFTLRHQAAYLKLQPYLNTTYMTESGYNGVFKLLKIEITSAATSIAGTYGFNHSEGIVTSNVTSPSNTITLNCENGFNIASGAGNSCYVVIRPGTHILSIKYYVKDLFDATVTFTETLGSKEYKPNGVTTIIHELGASGPDIMVFNPVFYRWGAASPWPTVQNTGTSAATIGMWQHCINQNEASWYVAKGDPRWDATTPWMIEGDATIYYGGVWIKKRSKISGFSSTVNTLGGNNSHPNGSRFFAINSGNSGIATTYQTAGKPADTSDYFFLPALGSYSYTTNAWEAIGTHADWWTRTPAGTSGTPNAIGTTHAFNVYFNASSIGTQPVDRRTGYLMGTKSHWFK